MRTAFALALAVLVAAVQFFPAAAQELSNRNESITLVTPAESMTTDLPDTNGGSLPPV